MPSFRPTLEALESRFLPSSAYLRIVTYNISADVTSGNPSPGPGFLNVLKAIGQEDVNGQAQPADIVALQETTSNVATVDPIVSALNSNYQGSAVYSRSAYQATQKGGVLFGNGPNALIFNTLTVSLLSSVGVGTPGGSANGEYRQTVRYQFQIVGRASAGVFYVYDSHFKSTAGDTGTDAAADANYRDLEAQMIRNDEAQNLQPNARVLYVGDYNVDSSGDAAYQTFTATASPSGISQGQGFDPINRPGDWSLNAAFKDILTESAKDLRYRDDFELVTANVLNDTEGGLGYVAGTYHAFGNDGTTKVHGKIDSPDLLDASDHLPVVADYLMIPPPRVQVAPLLRKS